MPRVALIDDDDSVRETISHMLEHTGCEMVAFPDAAPDMVFTIGK